MGQTHLRHRPWLNLSPRSSSLTTRDRVVAAAHGQLYTWGQWCKKYSRSSFNHLQRLCGYSSTALHWGMRASRGQPLASCNRVQVFAPALYGSAEDSLHRASAAWWANYTTTHSTDYQVSWTEFCSAFRTHYIPAGVMRKKHQEFMDLKQGGRSVHKYSKLFNYLVQYAPDQVHTDDKKKDRFMIGLSTKLQERMALNTGGSFP
jgi:hypothetical protein